MINPGEYTNLPNEEYHGDKNSISRSALMDFKKSPRNYWATHINPDRPPKETKASWEFGTAFHTLILEPDKWGDEYSVMPEKKLLRDVGREEYDANEHRINAVKQNVAKNIILTMAQYTALIEMEKSLKSNMRVCQLIKGAICESSYFWQDEHSGLIVKSRPDILNHNCYIDLKTIDDASPENFQREMAKYGYHIQAAMVKDAIKILRNENLSACINICVEKKYPYSIGVYFIDEAAIECGQMEYKQLLLDLKACIVENDFRDYPVQTIGLPRWY